VRQPEGSENIRVQFHGLDAMTPEAAVARAIDRKFHGSKEYKNPFGSTSSVAPGFWPPVPVFTEKPS